MTDNGNHKRQRMSPPTTPDIDDMEVAPQPTNGDNSSSRSRADSNASSDWDDWADAMVAQGEPPGESAAAGGAPGGGGVGGGGGGGMAVDEQDEEWVRSLMEQGTVGSVIEGMESPAWDYVLQMVVEERERGGAATVESPVQEITGVAATEFVSRWLRSNLPITLPALNALTLIEGGCTQQHQRIGSRSGDGQEQRRVRGGRALADSVAEPSSVAVVSCSPEQGMHRVNLFSLSANSGAALAAAVVQPGAVGLLVPPVGAAALGEETVARGYNSNDTRGSSGEVSGRRSTTPGCTDRGVVFESLDSRILEDALVSAMRRLGLGLKNRSRSGMWKLRPGAVLPAGDTSITSAEVRPVTLEDVGFIARCCSSGLGEVGRSEALVRGLIGRNPSAGIRRGSQLVAWCLSFDNGLAGALYIAPQTTESGLPLPVLPPLASGGEEEGQFSPRNMVLALLGSLLARPPGTDRAANNTPTARTDDEATRSVSDAASSTEEKQVGLSGSSLAHGRGAGGGVSVGLEAVVVDDDSPFAGLFGELELLERVCDADWVRFEPLASCSSGASGAPAVVAPVPLSALVLNP